MNMEPSFIEILVYVEGEAWIADPVVIDVA